MRKIRNWVNDDREYGKSPIRAVTEKRDGFQVIIDKTGYDSMGLKSKLLTKQGNEYNPKSNGRLGAIGRAIRRRFGKVINTSILHPKAGRATKLYCEVVHAIPGVGDSLQRMMHCQPSKLSPNGLLAFDCDFANADVPVPLAEKLNLMRAALGEEHVVRTLLNPRHTATLNKQLKGLEAAMSTGEGVVAEVPFATKQGGGKRAGAATETTRLVKHKTALPIPLSLVAIGFTDMQTAPGGGPEKVRIPSHFAWAIESEPDAFTVVLVDNKTHLFNPNRAQEGKILIKATDFVRDGSTGMYSCTNTTFAGQNYSALLAMAPRLVKPDTLTKHTAQAGKRKHAIQENRSFDFEAANFVFLETPARGVVAGNCFWMTGKHATAGGIHIQAPQFLASSAYGEGIHQALIPGHGVSGFPEPAQFTVDKLIRIATMPRNTLRHADIVYGYSKVNLVYGELTGEPVYFEGSDEGSDFESPPSTPVQHEDEAERDFIKRKFAYDMRPGEWREKMGLDEWSSVP
jgi:hypothetical protein